MMVYPTDKPLTRRTNHDAGSLPSRPPAYSSAAIAGIGALAASALANTWLARKAERDNPPVGRFMSIDGVQLHYLERGQGPTLVLLHGNGFALQDLVCSGLVDRAARNFRVFAFDRPGFGYSQRPRRKTWTPSAQADLLNQALRELGVTQAIVFAHSWGTAPALELALSHPEFVSGLVLASGYYYPTPRADVPLFGAPAIPLIGDVMRFTISPVLARALWPRIVKRIFSPRPVPPAFAAFPKELVFRPSQLRASAEEAVLMIPEAASRQKRYKNIKPPTVILAGDQDRYVDFDTHSARLQRDIPNSILLRVPGNGHMVHYTATDTVMDAIERMARKAKLNKTNAELEAAPAS